MVNAYQVKRKTKLRCRTCSNSNSKPSAAVVQLLSQKKGLVEKEELLTDHEAAADMRRHSSCEEQVQQPAEGQSAESIR